MDRLRLAATANIYSEYTIVLESSWRSHRTAEAITRGGEVNPFFSVSPDRPSITFEAKHGIRSSVRREDLDNGAVTQLTNDQYNDAMPDWSPDVTVTRSWS